MLFLQAMKQSGLKVLCIHGEGLQGLATISVVDELCGQVAQQTGLPRCHPPGALFDVISGTGIGSFIAILLGKYGLDTSRCKQLYMDLSTFIEDRKRMRHSNDLDDSIGRGEMEKFMDMLISEEGWSDPMLVPVREFRPRCQHVFVMQNDESYGVKSPNIVYHAESSPAQKTRRSSLPIASVSSTVSAAIGASVANGINRWVSEAGLESEEHNASQIHGTVLDTLEELWKWYPSKTEIDLLISVGPCRLRESESPTSPVIPASPRGWISDRTPPISSILKWPMSQAEKTRSKLENAFKLAPMLDNSFSPPPRTRTKSIPATVTPPRLDTNRAEEGESKPSDIKRKDMAKTQLRKLLNSDSGQRYFNFPSTSGTYVGGISDMVDLKETRYEIKGLVDSLSRNGTLTEAARRLELAVSND